MRPDQPGRPVIGDGQEQDARTMHGRGGCRRDIAVGHGQVDSPLKFLAIGVPSTKSSPVRIYCAGLRCGRVQPA